MSRLVVCAVALWFVMAVGGSALCHGPQDSEPQYGYGFRWELDQVVSHALGGCYLHGPGWDLSSPGWYSMSRENQEKLELV